MTREDGATVLLAGYTLELGFDQVAQSARHDQYRRNNQPLPQLFVATSNAPTNPPTNPSTVFLGETEGKSLVRPKNLPDT